MRTKKKHKNENKQINKKTPQLKNREEVKTRKIRKEDVQFRSEKHLD